MSLPATPRAVILALSALGAITSATRNAPAADPGPPASSTPEKAPAMCDKWSEKQHLLGLGVDAGQGPASFAARYLHSHAYGSGCDGLGGIGWIAYGAELRPNVSPSGLGFLLARAGFAGDAGGISVELGFGGGTNFHNGIAAGLVGAFWSLYYVDIGGSYEFPIGQQRPDWLGALQFAIRVHVPVHKYDRHAEQYPADRKP